MMILLLRFVLLLMHVQPLVIPGERLMYDVNSSRLGKIGRAELSTSLVETEAGSVLRLTFESNAKIFLFKASDRTVSDLDPQSLRTLRYMKRERSPVSKRDENVTVDYAARTWTDGKKTRPLACDDALDELSFIFLIRSIDLAPGQELVLRRHFDNERNPVIVRALPAISDSLHVLEMEVPDKRQDSGVSVLRFYLSHDERRVPVRIESSMPLAGRITMTLQP
jgi:hypothetical protein